MSESNVFTVTFPDKSEKYVKNVYTYEMGKGILYLKDENGEVKAAFKKWWGFEIK